MTKDSVKQKILDHLDGLNDLERGHEPEHIISVISERYDVPPEAVEQAIAEWSSGSKRMHKER
ncbi:hypothetical protein [Sneathiella sp.]|uniref:hypothetical protein n=1 Tax=Sneathiella sp. TaxID=1964365 RepID=UPI003568A874